MEQPADAIVDATRALLKSFGYFVDHLWHINDVHFICEQHNLPKISDAEAMDVFTIATSQFDGEIGMSWPQIEAALGILLQKKALLSQPVAERI